MNIKLLKSRHVKSSHWYPATIFPEGTILHVVEENEKSYIVSRGNLSFGVDKKDAVDLKSEVVEATHVEVGDRFYSNIAAVTVKSIRVTKDFLVPGTWYTYVDLVGYMIEDGTPIEHTYELYEMLRDINKPIIFGEAQHG